MPVSCRSVERLLSLENRASKLLEELKGDIVSRVKSVPFRGKRIEGKPWMGIVMSSELFLSQVWSAEYHFPEAQSEAVGKRISGCSILKQLEGAVSDMMSKKYIVSGDNKIYLNDGTLKAIAESPAGKHVVVLV